jgi:hypothetical protein
MMKRKIIKAKRSKPRIGKDRGRKQEQKEFK